MKYWLAIPCILLILVAVLVIRALKLKPAKTGNEKENIEVKDDDEAVKRFQTVLKQKTVWDSDESKIDYTDFDTYIDTLKTTYPTVFENVELNVINKYGIVLKFAGKNSTLKPIVLMGHYDVVPADESEWKYPPFGAEIHNGTVYARGAVDTKCVPCAVFEAFTRLIKEGFTPERDIYFTSSNNEEVGGKTTPEIVKWFSENGIEPYMVLDEGGAITDSLPLGIKNPFAMIGVTEKGSLNLRIKLRSEGGHSSTPSKSDAPAQLIRALSKVLDNPDKADIPKSLEDMLMKLASHSSFVYRLIFANLWLFKPVVKIILQADKATNAILRTTDAITMLEGSNKINVLPTTAAAGLSIRLNTGDTAEKAISRIKDAINNDNAEFEVISTVAPSPVSDFYSEECQLIKDSLAYIYPKVDVAPYLMTGGTDSKHFSAICDYVYKFAGIEFSAEERAGVHSVDEGLRISSFLKGIEFYKELIKRA